MRTTLILLAFALAGAVGFTIDALWFCGDDRMKVVVSAMTAGTFLGIALMVIAVRCVADNLRSKIAGRDELLGIQEFKFHDLFGRIDELKGVIHKQSMNIDELESIKYQQESALETCMRDRDAAYAAIRKHRDYRGDDRCWIDDEELYRFLPEGCNSPVRDAAVELKMCERYIACRHNPDTEYVSPQRRIEELEGEVERLRTLAREKFQENKRS